jgi:hypothetical protein
MAKKSTVRRIHDAMDKAERSAWKRVRAYVVMKGADHVATIKIAYPADGAGRLVAFCFDCNAPMPEDAAARENWTRWQMGTASGYGYDKLTAALSGMVIDGIRLSDHGDGAGVLPLPEGAKVFPEGFKPPPGYHLTNYSREHGGLTSCYRSAGLRYLQEIGYTVIQAI